jgi:hypothetical protein
MVIITVQSYCKMARNDRGVALLFGISGYSRVISAAADVVMNFLISDGTLVLRQVSFVTRRGVHQHMRVSREDAIRVYQLL